MKKLYILFIGIFIGAKIEAAAGSYAAYLTFWGPSARALGLAGAMTAIADDASAMYFNPAGLAQLNTNQLTFMHSILFPGGNIIPREGGTYADVLMYARPAGPTAGIGVTIFHINTQRIQHRDKHGMLIGPGTLDNKEFAGILTYSGKLARGVLGGLSIKLLGHTIGTYSGMGFGLDMGMFLFPENRFSIGINIQNITGMVLKMNMRGPAETKEPEDQVLPLTIRIGAAVRPYKGLVLAADVFPVLWASDSIRWKKDEKGDPIAEKVKTKRLTRIGFAGGAEFRPHPKLIFRGGANTSSINIGMGLWQDVLRYETQLDFTFSIPAATDMLLKFAYNLSLTVFFGGYRAKAYSPIAAFSPTSGMEEKNLTWLYFDINPRTEVKNWQVLIKDETGTTVRKIGAWGEPPYRIAWDGKDDNGVLVPDGRYYYHLRVVETGGKVWEYDGFLSSVYTVGPPGTVLIKSKAEPPKFILEERKEEKKEEEKRPARRRVRRR